MFSSFKTTNLDKLATLILRNECLYESIEEIKRDLERALSNRIYLLFLKKILQYCKKFNCSEIEEIYNKALEVCKIYDESFWNLVTELNQKCINYVIFKQKPFKDISFDIDIYFPIPTDYFNFLNIYQELIKLRKVNPLVRIDPHVAYLRPIKALNIILKPEDLDKNVIEICTSKNCYPTFTHELEVLITMLHTLKHRELYLGDLLTLQYHVTQSNEKELLKLIEKYRLFPIWKFYISILKEIEKENLNMKFPVKLSKSFVIKQFFSKLF